MAAIRQLITDATAATQPGTRAIVIDLSRVFSLDSVGVSALVSVRRKTPSNIAVVLAGLTAPTQVVARVCHLHEVFEIYTSFEAAERALAS